MPQPPAPFECTFTPNLPELLLQLECSLVLSTYQAGKLVIFSPRDAEGIVQLPRNFQQPMAVGLEGDRLAIATKDEVLVLANAPSLAPDYPRQPGVLDALFVPRAVYFTGRLDIHGLSWGGGRLWAVATRFSCLASVDDDFSFTPRWRPPFIPALASEDRCHLHGMATDEAGEPVYVTALGTGDAPESWRQGLPGGGALIHVGSSEVVASELMMPHSPRIYDGKLYMLLSASGELVAVDPATGKLDVVQRIEGFIRGMTRHGDYVFVARSRLRKNASTFKDLPIAEKARTSGLTVIHLPTGAAVAEMTYNASVDEIFDVQVLPGLRRPGILNTMDETHRLALTTPEATFWAQVPDPDGAR
jgi:uncharacterized protein (TIGR03032 family)